MAPPAALPSSVSIPIASDGFGPPPNTLTEPVWDTVKRDLTRIIRNLKLIIFPNPYREDSGKALRDWDLWGPFFFIVFLGLTLSWYASVKKIQEEKELKGNYRAIHDARKKSGHSKSSIAIGELNFTSIETIDLPPPSKNECVNLDNPLEVNENSFFTNHDGPRESNNTINLDEEEHRTSSCSGHKGASYEKKERKIRLLEFYKNDCSIKNCLAILESIEELSDEEKALATNIFKCLIVQNV
ncbi:hypothetical protein GUJ93_ZPchr0378g16432 [Zizania palustris]|uniref:Uncharacterized protein n=1 Tax=Zizania palustris TaxID=103762 RepID=A0A8J5TAM2_ZIZPA|nr:hypothetical protein GUJ93_ZPchr0378g16432 [Zizania palustris]